jgi:hypothetical protein
MLNNIDKLKSDYLIGTDAHNWVAGASSPITRVVLKENGNWKDLNIPNEIQVENIRQSNTYDTSMCVSFNGVEDPISYIMMQQLRLNMIPAWKVNWLKDEGYFKNGVLNFSERFIGILGGTTDKGAYQYRIAQAAREYGMIPNDDLLMANSFAENINPDAITQQHLDKGKGFANLFTINYEWVPRDKVTEFLKYSPLASFGMYGNMEGDTPIKKKLTGCVHSMLVIGEGTNFYEIDDSYWQQFKKYEKDALDGFMAFYVTSNNSMEGQQFLHENDLKMVWSRKTGKYYFVLQQLLRPINSTDRNILLLCEIEFRKCGRIEIPDSLLNTLPIGQF